MKNKSGKCYTKKDIEKFISSIDNGNGVYKGFSKFFPSKKIAENYVWNKLNADVRRNERKF
jgi:hypothetical protein